MDRQDAGGDTRGPAQPDVQRSDGQGGTLAAQAAVGDAKVGDLKNFHSLVPHAQTLRKAIFELEADDVIRGGQLTRARESEDQFRDLCQEIIHRT